LVSSNFWRENLFFVLKFVNLVYEGFNGFALTTDQINQISLYQVTYGAKLVKLNDFPDLGGDGGASTGVTHVDWGFHSNPDAVIELTDFGASLLNTPGLNFSAGSTFSING
jgi:hypothetical protein